jgi:hypothetical protein
MIHLGQRGGALGADVHTMTESARTICTNVLAVLVVAVLLWQAYLLLGG